MEKRLYTVSDIHLLGITNEFYTSLEKDLPDFTAVNATFDAAYLSAFRTVIDAAVAELPNASLQATLRTKTEAVKTKMAEAYAKVRQMVYYVGQVWPGDASRQTEAGTAHASRLHGSTAAMLESLRLMSEMCARYPAQFLAAGMSQAQMDAIATVRAELQTLKFEQESFSKSLPVRSRERVDVLNEAYRYMQRINALAKVVYATDPASRRRYKLPGIKRKKKEAVGGVVVMTDGQVGEIVTQGITPVADER